MSIRYFARKFLIKNAFEISLWVIFNFFRDDKRQEVGKKSIKTRILLVVTGDEALDGRWDEGYSAEIMVNAVKCVSCRKPPVSECNKMKLKS